MLGKLCFDCVPSRKEYDIWISEPALEWILDDFVFILDLEYAEFHKTWKAVGPPKNNNNNNSNHSDVMGFDRASYIYTPTNMYIYIIDMYNIYLYIYAKEHRCITYIIYRYI